MNTDIAAGILAFLPGLGIALLNAWLTRRVMNKSPDKLAMMSIPRQLLNILYLAALYALASLFGWPLIPLLVGGVIGVTIPSVLMALFMATRNGRSVPSTENQEKEGY